jgi:hypothetical protein
MRTWSSNPPPATNLKYLILRSLSFPALAMRKKLVGEIRS